MKTWKNFTKNIGNDEFPPDMIIDFILDSNEIQNNQALLFVDKNNYRNKVNSRSIILESWKVSFEKLELNEDLPIVYKKSIVLFRALITLIKLLPCYNLFKRLNKRNNRSNIGLKLGCRLSANDNNDESDDSITPIDYQLSNDVESNIVDHFDFNPITTPIGKLHLSVRYRSHVNFLVDDIESLLSSHFVDEDYYTPTLTKHKLSTYNQQPSNSNLNNYINSFGRVRTASLASYPSFPSSPPSSYRPPSIYSGISPSPSLLTQPKSNNNGVAIPNANQQQGQGQQIASSNSLPRRYSSSFGYRRTSSIGTGGNSSGDSVSGKYIPSQFSPNQPSPPSFNLNRRLSSKLSQSQNVNNEESSSLSNLNNVTDDDEIGDFIKLIDSKPNLKSSSVNKYISKQDLDNRLKDLSMNNSIVDNGQQSLKHKQNNQKNSIGQDFSEVVGQLDFEDGNSFNISNDVRRSLSAPTRKSSVNDDDDDNKNKFMTTVTTSPANELNEGFYYGNIGACRGRQHLNKRFDDRNFKLNFN